MRKKRIVCIAAILAVLCIAGLLFRHSYFFLHGKIYSRNTKLLDLRGSMISVSEYNALRKNLPACEILWNIPFQGNFFPADSQALTITILSDTDVEALRYFPALKAVNAAACKDYSQLEQLRTQYPQLTVHYTVTIADTDYPWDCSEITITEISPEVLSAVQHLPNLKTIHAESCTDLQDLKTLWESSSQYTVFYEVPIAGISVAGNIETLSLKGISTDTLVEQLPYLPKLRKIMLQDPVDTAEKLRKFRTDFPQISITWQTEILGIPVSSEDLELDLSGIALESTDTIRQAAQWLPNLEKVIACNCGIDNESMATFRNEVRSQYKVVWEVSLGRRTIRTDETWCHRNLTDKAAYNLRYCEDMVCIDLGHQPIYNLDWAAYMPNLKYLIVADTGISDLTPLAGLQHLTYLELFKTRAVDLTLLLSCPALEDLNIGGKEIDVTPVKQITWLKRLWWLGCPVSMEELKESLPDTEIVFPQWSYTADGWREGENYYAQRDFMGEAYMVG